MSAASGARPQAERRSRFDELREQRAGALALLCRLCCLLARVIKMRSLGLRGRILHTCGSVLVSRSAQAHRH